MIDPYAKVNERIRNKRRAQGRRDNQYDALIRSASQEVGAVTEAAMGIFLDIVERVALRYLEQGARMGATRGLHWTPDAVRAARYASTRVPGASGRVVSQSSEWVVQTGLSVLKELRRNLEDTRREAAGSSGRARQASAPVGGRRRAAAPPRSPKPRKRPDREPPTRPPDRREDRRE